MARTTTRGLVVLACLLGTALGAHGGPKGSAESRRSPAGALERARRSRAGAPQGLARDGKGLEGVSEIAALGQELRGGGSVKTKTEATTKAVLGDLSWRITVGSLFALWYFLNVAYNIVNKEVLNAFPKALTVGWLQLGMGSVYVVLGWLTKLRPQPIWSLSFEDQRFVAPAAFFHGFGQLATVTSLGAGAVSFTHIVKALEPFFSAIASAMVLGEIFPWQVYASLIPVVGGVAVAVAKDVSFNWVSFISAMMSNQLFGLRANYSKLVIDRLGKQRLSPANLYACVTLLAFILISPLVLAVEGPGMRAAFDQAVAPSGAPSFLLLLAASGALHYLNNEIMFLVLGKVQPVTLAVANTLKRVIIIASAVAVFGTELTPMTIAGSGVGIGGALLYSLARQKYV